MNALRAIVVDPSAPARLALKEISAPTPSPSEALVRVAAFSLNLGEVRGITTAQAGYCPGWDLSGVVEQSAADGSGPQTGKRVVGWVRSGAWAELVAVPTQNLAEIPEKVSFGKAATLPIAGLTALRALEKGGNLLDKKVLITGATGGVGHLAVQLAHHAGARVVGVARRPEGESFVLDAGAHEVVVGEQILSASQFGPYHLIIDSVGGKVLGQALGMLAPGGTCVNFGASEGAEVTFDLRKFFLVGGATFYGLIIFYELARRPGAEDLASLARMIDDGRLLPQIAIETSWTQTSEVVQKMLNREITGKAVLCIE
ncbi:zinc-binding dehydrogenase [Tengunoibacter tsumagoiensis]|uniref:Oxidoreductase n=1 Tax=Tengunoibacter tsumagoiensis TaxID=2014871 RepID=A0A402A3T6_9CHLR|nr:zinc-binding dehydrogenase [Tengunoibacter tsumagoiensis]GCE13706.1 oxidoreductase [Tengunoibacter tsumagoiensis]